MAVAGFYRRVLPSPPAIEFSSPEGKLLFAEALGEGTMEGFFKLISYYQTQSEPAYCGLATLAMVLNALAIDPGRKWKGPWRWFDDSMLDCCEPLSKIKAEGITFGKVACLARCNGASVVALRANESTVIDFRKTVISCTSSEACHVITSYHRGVFKQTGTGHFSPIGGYHAGKDMVLILDVARFKYPPHWVPLNLLWDSMNTIDKATGQPRGYMIVSKPPRGPSILYTVSCQHEGWNNITKYLTEKVPNLLKSEDVNDIQEVLSTVFRSPPQDLSKYILWVAEVRRQEAGNVVFSEEERGRLAIKEEILGQLRETDLFKHVTQWFESGVSPCKSKDLISLYEIAATVCCQGAQTLAGRFCCGNQIRCTRTNVNLLKANGEKPVAVVSGIMLSHGNEQGVDMLVPLCKNTEPQNSHVSDECSCNGMLPSMVDVLTILLLSLPQHTWSGIKEEKLLAEVNRLVATDYLPTLLQEEVICLRQQIHFLTADCGASSSTL